MLLVDLAEEGLQLRGADKQDWIDVVGEGFWLVKVKEVPSLCVKDVGVVEVRLDDGLVGLSNIELLP